MLTSAGPLFMGEWRKLVNGLKMRDSDYFSANSRKTEAEKS